MAVDAGGDSNVDVLVCDSEALETWLELPDRSLTEAEGILVDINEVVDDVMLVFGD